MLQPDALIIFGATISFQGKLAPPVATNRCVTRPVHIALQKGRDGTVIVPKLNRSMLPEELKKLLSIPGSVLKFSGIQIITNCN